MNPDPRKHNSIRSTTVNWIMKKEEEPLDFSKYVSDPIPLTNNRRNAIYRGIIPNKKKSFFYGDNNKIKIVDINDISNKIKLILLNFYKNHPEKEKFINFEQYFKNDIIDCLYRISYFSEFNYFEEYKKLNYMTASSEANIVMIERNNFFLSSLNYFEKMNPSVKMLKIVERFVDINISSPFEIDLVVDFFFLIYYDYKSSARTLASINQEYFRSNVVKDKDFSLANVNDFIQNFNSKKPNNTNTSNQKRETNEMYFINKYEFEIVKEVIYGCIRRKLINFLLILMKYNKYLVIFKKKRVWEMIILTYPPEDVFLLWKRFFKKYNNNKLIEISSNDKISKGKNLARKEKDNGIQINNFFKEEFFTQLKKRISFHFLYEIITNCLIYKKSYSHDKNSEFVVHNLIDLAYFLLEKKDESIILDEKIFDLSFEVEENLAYSFINIIAKPGMDPSYMISALEKKYFKIAMELSKFRKCREILHLRESQEQLVKNINSGEYSYYTISLLNLIDPELFFQDNLSICFFLFKKLIMKDEEFLKNRYPIITCLLAAEYLMKLFLINIRLGNVFTRNSMISEALANMYINLCSMIIRQNKDESSLNYQILEQKDIFGRNSLEIIAHNKFFSLMKQGNIREIVDDLWYGKESIVKFSKFCSVLRIIKSDIKYEPLDKVERTNLGTFGESRQYYFQFNIYIRNCYSRYLTNLHTTIITSMVYLTIIYYYIQLLTLDYNPFNDSSFIKLNIFGSFLILSSNFQYISSAIFNYKTRRKMEFSIELVIDMVNLFCIILNIIQFNSYSEYTIIEDCFVPSLTYSIMIICRFLKLILILRETRVYGPYLNIVFLIIPLLLNFLFIFMCIITFCAQIFYIFFHGINKDFSTYTDSWINLFSAAYGIYDFSNFTADNNFGYCLLMLYITFSNLMLLNLIVSIISKFYEYKNSVSHSEINAILVNSHRTFKWDEKYGFLILMPVPFNLISIIFIFYIFYGDESKLELVNEKISKFAFFLILIQNFVQLMFVSLVLYPICLIKTYIHLTYELINNFSKNAFYFYLMELLIRPIRLLYVIYNDLLILLSKSFEDSFTKEKPKENDLVFVKEAIYFLHTLFKYKLKSEKKKVVRMDELITETYISNCCINKLKEYKNTKSLMYSRAQSILDQEKTLNAKENNTEIMRFTLSIIERLTDSNKNINIYVCIHHIPYKISYSNDLISYYKYFSLKSFSKALNRFHFLNTFYHPSLTSKKLNLLLNKIFLKIKIFNTLAPDQSDSDSSSQSSLILSIEEIKENI